MKIILDAMGGDNAPQAVVQGALEAHAQCGADIVLVGREEDIRACLTGPLPEGVEIVNATEVVEMCDDPATAFKRKKDSSLTVGLTMLKNGEGDAFVSAGSTGALLAGATPAGEADPGGSPGGHGACTPHRYGPRSALRLRRQRRLYAGISAAICVSGQFLRPAAHGGGEAPGGPAEHRCRAVQGRYPPP